jgi:hypothetical protein
VTGAIGQADRIEGLARCLAGLSGRYKDVIERVIEDVSRSDGRVMS